jgi:hypothetical protein
MDGTTRSYRIEGGVPAGIIIIPPESGDRKKRMRIRITTRHGKASTAPTGIATVEPLFNRIRRLKKSSQGDTFSRRGVSSNFPIFGFADGNLLVVLSRSAICSAYSYKNASIPEHGLPRPVPVQLRSIGMSRVEP